MIQLILSLHDWLLSWVLPYFWVGFGRRIAEFCRSFGKELRSCGIQYRAAQLPILPSSGVDTLPVGITKLLDRSKGVPPSVTKNLHTSLWYILMNAEDLWTMDVWRIEKALKGCQSRKSSLCCWKFRRCFAWCIHGTKRRPNILLCCWIGSLFGPICNSLQKTSYFIALFLYFSLVLMCSYKLYYS
ncbi:PREDICTED: uncharacterized protein LOC109224770 isoform X2 [Nicotiana attenuata]|uniref:uncharacterized protein LOC109224770 isoform X2 n=1 Tax=Nicotiana attenuata TaxID=49451 RepID=UPI000905B5AC|nr:PREDICTED: uncharacterized protein LOC109224770 isoform X2 [Nicotiana attenuata]